MAKCEENTILYQTRTDLAYNFSVEELNTVYLMIRTAAKDKQTTTWSEPERLNFILRQNPLIRRFAKRYPTCWNFTKHKKFRSSDSNKWKHIIATFTEYEQGLISQTELQNRLVKRLTKQRK